MTGTEIYFRIEVIHLANRQDRSGRARKLSALAERDWRDEAAYFVELDGNALVLARPGPLGN